MNESTPGIIRLSRKASGAYFTPGDIAAALVSWVIKRPSDRMLDPSCGDGCFLACHPNAVGIERDAIHSRDATARAPSALVHEGDFFTWAGSTAERFEGVAGNPPFIRYQTFAGETRARALSFCATLGVKFSGLTSSWAPFLVAAAALLKPGGALAFIIPAEVGHAPYAAPLLEYLVRSFSSVRVIAIREKLFPMLSEDCWLLHADGRGGRTNHIDLAVVDRFQPSSRPPEVSVRVDVEEWRTTWNRRLRPYLLPMDVRRLYQAGQVASGSCRFSDFATIGIGYVSGDNSFFHLRPSEAIRWKIENDYLKPSVRNSRALPNHSITQATLDAWHRNDEQVLLLRLQRGQKLPDGIQRYLDSTAGRQARIGYKCRNRKPWYVVPDVQTPDYIMGYMSGRTVGLVRNDVGVTCSNSVHSVRIRDRAAANRRLPLWKTPFIRLSCELEGHALGGGMLKLEPGEASRILFPAPGIVTADRSDMLNEAVGFMQRWRHYAT